MRLRRKPGRGIQGARADRHLWHTLFVPKQARPALATEALSHRGRRRVPLESALLDELEPGAVNGCIGPDVAMPAAALRAVAERDRSQFEADRVPRLPD